MQCQRCLAARFEQVKAGPALSKALASCPLTIDVYKQPAPQGSGRLGRGVEAQLVHVGTAEVDLCGLLWPRSVSQRLTVVTAAVHPLASFHRLVCFLFLSLPVWGSLAFRSISRACSASASL